MDCVGLDLLHRTLESALVSFAEAAIALRWVENSVHVVQIAEASMLSSERSPGRR